MAMIRLNLGKARARKERAKLLQVLRSSELLVEMKQSLRQPNRHLFKHLIL